MSDEMPQATRVWPPKSDVVLGLRVGDKCIVSWLPDEEGDWLEAGGVMPIRAGGLGLQEGDLESSDMAPTGGGGVDPAQARIYYRCVGEDQAPEVRIVLPDDAPFRACRKGMRKGRSKSFDDDGSPVPEVRLLHALKTGHYDDRSMALESLPLEAWGDRMTEFDARIFQLIDYYSGTVDSFLLFVGEILAKSASKEKGLSDWLLWEKVADDAAGFTRNLLAIANGQARPNNHSRFMQAVKESTAEFHGLPTQAHVEERWREFGGIGAWKEIRKTLGFEWIPSQTDWKKYWRPLIQKSDATSP